MEEIRQRFPATIELTMGAMLFATVFGVAFGIIAAYRHNSVFDVGVMFIALWACRCRFSGWA